MAQLKFPAPGFDEFSVPEMPSHVAHYSKRGNTHYGEQTPVRNFTRFGNRTGKGGMNAYLSQAEDPTFLEGYRVKKGDAGVYENLRWAPGNDWRGGYGISSLSQTKNYAGIQTRGGQLRSGGPRRGDVVERANAWYDKTMPGISHGRYTQKNQNYAGLYDWKRRTPTIQTEADPLILRNMIEHNPWHINSHGAAGAKSLYDKEFRDARQDKTIPAYAHHLDVHAINSQPPITIRETQQNMLNRP